MIFTEDWFSRNIPGIEHCLSLLDEKSKFLEIGCFEGLSTCWLLEHMDAGVMYSIDNFAGDGDFSLKNENLFEIAKSNISEAVKSTQCHTLMRTTSYKGMAELISRNELFDFIYIDGSHDPRDILVDTCMAWGLLKKGGIIMFDDAAQDKVRNAISKFWEIFYQDFELVFDEYQMGIQKNV